jgi:hypothetical protein
MRKLLVLALAMGMLILSLGASASSADAACGIKCLKNKVRVLSIQVSILDRQLDSVTDATDCLLYFPVTRYGPGTASARLDITRVGDPVGYWMAARLPGTCGMSFVGR